MTIFDSLKYPLSIPPTEDEIHDIPDEIWTLFETLFEDFNKRNDLLNWSDVAVFNLKNHLLRKAILEYNT